MAVRFVLGVATCWLQTTATRQWALDSPGKLIVASLALDVLALAHSWGMLLLALVQHGLLVGMLAAFPETCPWFDVALAKSLARVILSPLQCRTCGFGPVGHFGCDRISGEECQLCGARCTWLRDGYQDWDPKFNFAQGMVRARRMRASERRRVLYAIKSAPTGLAYAVYCFFSSQDSAVLAVLMAMFDVALSIESFVFGWSAKAVVSDGTCARCLGSLRAPRRRGRSRKRILPGYMYNCGHRCHRTCILPRCPACFPNQHQH